MFIKLTTFDQEHVWYNSNHIISIDKSTLLERGVTRLKIDGEWKLVLENPEEVVKLVKIQQQL